MNKPLNPWKLTGYKAGQNVACKVVRPDPGGYIVHIPKDNLPGFLQTEAKLKEGEEVLAQFVCVTNNRVLLQARLHGTGLSDGKYKSQSQSRENWQLQLDGPGQPALGPIPIEDERDAAFKEWARDRPTNFKLRRAIDLILPSISSAGQEVTDMRVGDEELEWLITTLEGGMKTGCVKAFCEPRKSRSAVLLYRGRAVGCIYGSRTLHEQQTTEISLQMMLQDLNEPDTQVTVYDLPEEVTLAMSALFLGYPVERTDDLDAKSYIEHIGSWLSQREQTACLAVTLTSNAMCLAFVHKGRYCGSFYVEEQKFAPDVKFLFDLVGSDPKAQVHASILPQEMTSTSVRFGFSLSMARKVSNQPML